MVTPQDEELSAARTVVRQALGADLEAKATDAFCLAHGPRLAAAGLAFGAESVTPRAGEGLTATVVEFVSDSPSDPARAVSASELRDRLDALNAILPADGSVRASGVLRQAFLAPVRNACYQLLTPVYDEIERLSGGSLQPPPAVLGSPQIPTVLTQICWLNRTLRTWAGPATLADVAAHTAITSIDVPQRLTPDSAGPSRSHAAIGLPAFTMANQLTGQGVTVAVIDHETAIPPALAGRVVQRRNYTSEPWGNPAVHGTAVAAIIGADDPDHPGVAPGVTIYNYKVLASTRLLHADEFDGNKAIQQALEDGCDIANCSWGAGLIGAVPSTSAVAVEAATKLGLTVVKSAGNRGPGPATMTAPADSLAAVVVGATDLDGQAVEDYSSRGPAVTRMGPDVVAPGGSVADQVVSALVGGGFGPVGEGTSFSTPLVTGVLALLLEQAPNLLPADLLTWVRDHARPLAGAGVADMGQGLFAL